MHWILSLGAIVLCLLLVVGIHEAGHALAAWYFDVKIKRISVGFGRPLFHWRSRNGCEWVWSMWPLGGSVELLNTRIEPVNTSDFKHCFDKKSLWARWIILLSGAAANAWVAFFALVWMFMLGFEQVAPVISTVKPSSVAAMAGLKPGDRVLCLAEHPTQSWQAVGMQLVMHFGQKNVVMVVKNRAGEPRDLTLNLQQWHYQRGDHSLLEAIGLHPDLSKKQTNVVHGVSWMKAIPLAGTQVFGLVVFFLVMLKQVLTGMIPFFLLMGPFGLFMAMAHSFFQGLTVFLYFIAHLSVVVGLVNLLPIPALDGGAMVYALVEKMRGKPVSIAFELLLYRLTCIGFCLLFVQLILNDARRYVLG